MNILIFVLLIGLIIATYFDLKYRHIPNILLLFLLIVGVAGILLFKCNTVMPELIKTLLISAVAYIVYVLSKERLGAGDLKLLIVMSLYLSLDDFLSVCAISFGLATACCLFLVAKRKASLKSCIPLVPFFLTGMVAELFILMKYRML